MGCRAWLAATGFLLSAACSPGAPLESAAAVQDPARADNSGASASAVAEPTSEGEAPTSEGEAAVELVTAGLPTVLHPSCQTDGVVYDVIYADGTFYLGGTFTSVGPPGAEPGGTVFASREGIAACDADTGAVLPWYPPGGVDGQVRALATDGTWLYVGGKFSDVGNLGHDNLARFSLSSAAGDESWRPSPDGQVRRIVVRPDGGMYVGGRFERIDGEAQAGIARLDAHGDLDDEFGPSVTLEGGGAAVFAVTESADGSALYVGGQFDEVNGEPRASVVQLDAATGGETGAFSPDLEDTNPKDGVVQVHQILLHDTGVYLCGDWWVTEGVGSQDAQRNLGRFDPDTGAADMDWLPSNDGGVADCLFSDDGTSLIIGGHFDEVNGETARKLAALDLDGARLVSGFPGGNSAQGVRALGAASGGRLGIAGEFTKLGGEPHRGFGVVGFGADRPPRRFGETESPLR
ncbi:MAG: delta-60 repeat domain-containing protein [Euzebyaceae bacterium]|nr:delta-60 repeat domain-containing protein [Euzebyaceae bacterium]